MKAYKKETISLENWTLKYCVVKVCVVATKQMRFKIAENENKETMQKLADRLNRNKRKNVIRYEVDSEL